VRTALWLYPDRPALELVEAIRTADRLGVDEVWLGDEGPVQDPFTVLAAAAVRTGRIRLGVGITNPYGRHPRVTAWQAATLADLSDGRFVLGLGPGGSLALQPLGVTPTRPLRDCQEALATIRATCTVPVYVGARGERFNRWASEAADGVLVAGTPVPFLEQLIGWARSVRAVPVTLCLPVAFDAEQLSRFRDGQRIALLDQPAEVRNGLGVGADTLRGAGVPDEVLAQCGLWGETAAIADRLRGLAERHRPTATGLALPGGDDLVGLVEQAAAVLTGIQSMP